MVFSDYWANAIIYFAKGKNVVDIASADVYN